VKILHIANFSLFPRGAGKRRDELARFYATDRKISAGLVRNGHCVFDFSYRDAARRFGLFGGKRGGVGAMNRLLEETAAAFAPELVLMGHCELVAAKTLERIRARTPGAKVAQWWVDYFWPHMRTHLHEKLPLLDAFFATTHPQAARAALALDGKPRLRLPPFYYLPNICDASVETARAFANPAPEYDVFYAARPDPRRAALLQVLRAMAGEVRLGLFGQERASFLGGAAFVRMLGNSRIGINYSHDNEIALYSSDRLIQLAGNGCLVMTPATPQMTRLFSEDEVVYFESPAQLPELVRKYLRDESECIRRARAGWRRAHGSYNERRAARFIVEAALGQPFGEAYEWLDAAERPPPVPSVPGDA